MKKFLLTILSISLIRCIVSAQHAHTDHGFVLLGDKQLHAYHLARFNSPHEYQVIFELKLTNDIGEEIDISDIKKQNQAEVLSILSTDHFIIPDLINISQPLKTFKVKLFKGYLRDRINRVLLMENINLEVVKVEYFTKISKNDINLKQKQMLLVCDDKANRFYGIHIINGKTDSGSNFEEVIEVSPLFSGSAPHDGGDETSVVMSCNDSQGLLGLMEADWKTHLDIPLSGGYFRFHNQKIGVWGFLDYKKLFLDLITVNN